MLRYGLGENGTEMFMSIHLIWSDMPYFLLFKLIFHSLEAKAINTYQLPFLIAEGLWSFMSEVEVSTEICDTSF